MRLNSGQEYLFSDLHQVFWAFRSYQPVATSLHGLSQLRKATWCFDSTLTLEFDPLNSRRQIMKGTDQSITVNHQMRR